MFRLLCSVLVIALSLSSCDKLLKIAKARSQGKGSLKEEIQIFSPAKPEVIAAFEAISKATYEHNRTFLQYYDTKKPANEISYSAGIDHLTRSAREHGGLAKQIIDAVAATRLYEKSLFTPFDTIDRQLDGMPTWSNNRSTQLRGYIQIIDQIILTYDGAVSYLERGEQPLQQRNFDHYRVPAEVSSEFFRLSRHGKQITEMKLGTFREMHSALQCYREAMTSADPAIANQHIAKAKQHEQKSKKFEAEMVAAIRKQMQASALL
jgi:hypothetical protein